MNNIWNRIKNFFKRGGAKVGLTDNNNTLTNITDDPRIHVPPEEYERMRRAKRYYEGKFADVKYWTLDGEKKRPLNSVNMAKLACRRLASIIFNEKCSIKVNDPALQAILDQVFRNNDFYLDFETHLEPWIDQGFGCVRPYVDNDQILLGWSDGLGSYPLDANTTQINQIALSRRLRKIENNTAVYYTLLEFHQWQPLTEDDQGNIERPYTITNELYRSTDENIIGDQVPLNTIDEFSNLEPETTFHNLTKPLFATYKNPGANNQNSVSPLGVGLCDNCLNILDAINETHDGFVWDVKTGYRRITIPRSWVRRQTNINGKPIPQDQQLYWDPNDGVFVPVNAKTDESSAFKDLAIDIRVDQYTQAMQFFLHEFENAIGLSQGSFTVNPTGVQTATEVVSNNSMTYQTRSSYLTMVEKTIDGLVYAIAELLKTPELWSDQKPKWDGDLDSLVISPDFADGVFVDQEAQRASDLQAVQAGVMPKVQFIMRNYDKTLDEAQQWLAEIQDEQSPTPPDQEMSMFPDENSGDDDGGEDDNTSQDDGSSEQDN